MSRTFADDLLNEEYDRQGFTVVRLLSAADAGMLLDRIRRGLGDAALTS